VCNYYNFTLRSFSPFFFFLITSFASFSLLLAFNSLYIFFINGFKFNPLNLFSLFELALLQAFSHPLFVLVIQICPAQAIFILFIGYPSFYHLPLSTYPFANCSVSQYLIRWGCFTQSIS
jgi:hypothetical protein